MCVRDRWLQAALGLHYDGEEEIGRGIMKNIVKISDIAFKNLIALQG